MTTKYSILKILGLVFCIACLTGCNGAEGRKAKYKQEGKEFLDAGEYEKAALAFKNVQQIDPKDWENHYLMAEVLSKQGKIEPAFREYGLVVSQDENNVMARVRLGQILLLGRNVDQAEKMADEALAKEPENVEALVLKAGVQTAKNNTDAAIATVDKALRINPDDVSATMMQASINVRMERMEQAIGILKAAIAKKPDNVPLHSMLGGLYVRNHQNAEAEEMFSSIIKLQPKDVQQYKSLAMFQVATNQLDKAEATLREAVQNVPDSNAAKANLVDFLVEKRSPDIAIAELLPLIEKNPEDYDLKFKLVSVQITKKDLAGAETTLKEIVEQNKLGPYGIKARDKLAALYSLTRRPEEAKNLINEVLEENPRDSEALTLRGQFELAESKIPEAIADFRSVLVDQPNNVAVLKMLSSAHLRNNEESLARENLEKVLAATPGDETVRLELATLLLNAGQKDQAKQQIETLLKNDPKSLKGLEALFKYDLAEKQWDKAQEVAKQVQQLKNKDATGYYMSGLGYQAANKLEASVEAFQQALAKKPDAVEPLSELVKTYIALKQPDKAIAKLQQIVKQQPNHIIAYNLLGGVYFSQQKFGDAKSAFESAKALKPEWFAPYRSLALVELAQKNKTGAIDILKIGIDKTKGSLELFVDLAQVYHNEGQNDKAVELYEEAYKKHPNSAMATNNLASFISDYAATPENLKRAADLAEPFLKSNNASLLDTVAWIAYKQGNYDKAKDVLLRAVELAPRFLISQYHLGMVYFKLNDAAKATEYLQKVVDAKVKFDGLELAKETLNKIKKGT